MDDIENGQSFQIAASNNYAGRLALKGQSKDEVYAKCQANLSHMTAVGTIDQLNRFQYDLRRNTGISLDIPRINQTRPRLIKREDLPEELVRYIRRLTEIDYKVYDMVKGTGLKKLHLT